MHAKSAAMRVSGGGGEGRGDARCISERVTAVSNDIGPDS